MCKTIDENNYTKKWYTITEEGKIYSKKKNRYLAHSNNGNGYLMATLTIGEGTYKKYYIHRLVASAYIEAPPKGLEINHKDYNKSNNHYSNLEWVTHAYNMKHGLKAPKRILQAKLAYNKRIERIGSLKGSRKLIDFTEETTKSGNYKVITQCLCGNKIEMHENDFNKELARHKYCYECSPRRLKPRERKAAHT